MNQNKIIIIVPTYNNPKTIKKVAFDVLTHNYEIIIIDDNSTEANSIIYLLDYLDIEDAISRYEEVNIWFGSAEDYAAELLADTTDLEQLPEIIKYHIDYSGIARDMELSSEITEVGNNAWVTNCMEF